MAKGLPFVSEVPIVGIKPEEQPELYLKVLNDASPINVQDVLDFYDKIYQKPEEQVIKRIRKYAEEHFSMEVAMKEVIDFFKSGK